MPATSDTDAMLHTFEKLREREKQRFRDERKGQIPTMDAATLRELCVDNDGYETPELNDNLYAHFQGFQRIQGLAPYYNLKALWLESNGLTKLENLESLVNLRCLYLSKNLIERIENLEFLKELNTLDLSENRIQSLAGIACLPKLSSLNLSRNLIESSDDLAELSQCEELTNIDISHNHIDDTRVLDVLIQIPKLRALRITGNEVVSKTKYFRKVYISKMPQLAFLDRPIFPMERTSVDAWAKGGNDAELAAKKAFVAKENDDRKKDLQNFRDWQAQVREKRIQELEQEKEEKKKISMLENPSTPECDQENVLREQDVDLRGFRGITTQEYIKLSPADRVVWDQRIEAAHRDSVRLQRQVVDDGVAAMGSKFWANQEPVKESVAVVVADREVPVVAEAAASLMPPPAPVAMASKQQASPPPPPLPPVVESPSVQVHSPLAHKIESASPPPPPLATQPEPPIFHRDPAKFFQEIGDTRRTWAELEQHAKDAPFAHRPTSLPSVLDDADRDDDKDEQEEEDEEGSEPTNAAAVPIRALTRDEILRDLARAKALSAPPLPPSAAEEVRDASGVVLPPPAPIRVTNVAALD